MIISASALHINDPSKPPSHAAERAQLHLRLELTDCQGDDKLEEERAADDHGRCDDMNVPRQKKEEIDDGVTHAMMCPRGGNDTSLSPAAKACKIINFDQTS